jgi:hypothetical protein
MSGEVKKTCAGMEFPRTLKEIKESPLHFLYEQELYQADNPSAKGFSVVEKR